MTVQPDEARGVNIPLNDRFLDAALLLRSRCRLTSLQRRYSMTDLDSGRIFFVGQKGLQKASVKS